jgi:sulfonate transport system permease protein
VHGFGSVEPRLYEVANALGLSKFEVIRKISLPSSMPDVMAGLRISLTVSLILAIVGEMLCSREGLGNWILISARSFRAADVFGGIILLSLIGYLSSMMLEILEHRILKWMRP